MPRKVTIELPESEYGLLETYCLEKQQTKRQIIRFLIQNSNKT